MGFWGTLGKIGGAIGGAVAAPFTGGASAMLIPAALGAGTGLAKHFLEDKPNQQNQARLAAETDRYAPWTGLHGKMPGNTSLIGSTMEGGLAGLSLGQKLAGGAQEPNVGVGAGEGPGTGDSIQQMQEQNPDMGFGMFE